MTVTPNPILGLSILLLLLCPGPAQEFGAPEPGDGARFPAEDPAALIDPLVSGDRLVRERGARRFREAVDSTAAEKLVRLLPGLGPARRKAVMDALASGGPWMPGVLRGAALGGESGRAAGTILRSALAVRPLSGDPPPLLGSMPIFGEGVDFSFPGTWPRAVPLDELLDWINHLAGPTHPLVLSPSLGARSAGDLAVRRAPVSGPAPMAVDVILMERGLGLRFLETVTLVTPGGRSCRQLSAHDQEFDEVLLDGIIDSLSRAPAGACRRAALQALAWLDPPGCFDGYVRELRSGDRGDSLDFLLTSGASARLAARLGLEKDLRTAAELIALWDAEPEGTRKRALARLLLLCPDGLREGALEAAGGGSGWARMLFRTAEEDADVAAAFLRSIEEGGEEELRTALQVCLLRLPRSKNLRGALLSALPGLKPVERPTTALVDRCLSVMGPWLEDDDLAGLVAAAGRRRENGSGETGPALSLKGALEIAARFGGDRCLDAVMVRFREESGERLTAVLALRRMAARLDIDLLEPARRDVRDLPAVCGDALVLALSRDGARRRDAARRLFGKVAAGEADASLVSLAGAAEIAEHAGILLGRVASGETALPPELRDALIRAPLVPGKPDALAANMIRLGLIDCLGDGMDPVLDLALWSVASIDQPGSYTFEIRLF